MAAKVTLSGDSTGVPWEIVSVMPFSRKLVPSVVMNDGTSNATVTKPLNNPTSALTSRATPTERISGRPAPCA